MKKTTKVFIGILSSILFLYLAFRKADFREIINILKQADAFLIVLTAIILILFLMVRSYRWKLLGRRYHNIEWIKFFHSTSIGLMLNVFFPFRAGDLAQAYLLSKKSGLPKSYTMSTVVIERLLDLMTVLTIIIFCSFIYVLPSYIDINFISIFTLLLGVGLFLILRFYGKGKSILRIFENTKYFDKALKVYGQFTEAVKFLNDKQVIAKVIPLTFFKWIAMDASANLFLLWAMDIHIGFMGALVVMAISSLSACIPASPGNIGTFEFFCLIALSMFDVDLNRALSFAILAHFLYLSTTILAGSFFICDDLLKKNKFRIMELG